MRRKSLLNCKTMILRIMGLLILAPLFVGTPTGSADPAFNASRVQSKSCRAPAFLCGFQPPTADDLAAVPLADPDLSNVSAGGPGGGLPARIDLSAQMPPVGDQGPHASGVAWALAFGLMSYEAAMDPGLAQRSNSANRSRKPCAVGAPGAERLFSPADLYNALNRGKDAGIDLLQAGRYLIQTGVASCEAAPYDPEGFQINRTASDALSAKAESGKGRFRARSLQRLEPANLAEIQARLAAGQPVVVGMSVYDDFYQLGRGVYELAPPSVRRRTFRGGHAVVLVGYDHNKKGSSGQVGAFRFLNSFSRDWGDQGYGWISYRAFRQLVRTAIILETGRTGSEEVSASGQSSGVVLAGPRPPAQVIASRGHFADRIVVQYSLSSGAVAYEISRAWPRTLSENKSEPFEIVGYSRGLVFVDRVVQPEVAFRYRVRAIGVSGVSGVSTVIGEGFATKTGKLNPLPLSVVGLDAPVAIWKNRAVINLTWSSASGAQAYRVMRFEVGRNRWRVLSRSQKETRYQDRRPQAGAWNIYRVQAINAAGRAAWSESARALVGGSGMAPAPVTNPVASRGRFVDRIELKWDPVPGADRYQVYRFASRGTGENEWEGPSETPLIAYVDALDDEGDRNGAYIAYRVAAGNAAGFSKPGPIVFGFARAVNDEGDESRPPLSPPTDLRLDSPDTGAGRVQLSWSPVTGASEYYVLRKRIGEADFGFVRNVAASQTAGGRASFREDFPGDPGELFLYTVRAKPASTAGQESLDSNIVAAFQRPKRQLVRKRFFWSSGGEQNSAGSNFDGVWTAMDWDGESGPRRIEMRITQTGPRFAGEYRIGNNPSRKFEGEYIYGSQVLEARGFQMELLRQPTVSNRAASESIVRINSRELSPYDVELAFERTGSSE